MRRKAFTLSELLVAMGLMVALLAGAGVVFRSAVQTQRASIALSEIMRKFHGITDQLNADFRGLRKDGEIVILWARSDDGSERFDRVMVFANGGFQTYNKQPVTAGSTKRITGNLARVCYMLASVTDGSGGVTTATAQAKAQRILSRTQHILTGDADLVVLPDLTSLPFKASLFSTHNFANEYDNSYANLQKWKEIPTRLKGDISANPIKEDIISIITGIQVLPSTISDGGIVIDHGNPATMHMFLCDGVGEFKVQSWGVDIDGNGIIAGDEARWFPEVDPDGDGDLSDSDFFDTDSEHIQALIYPGIVKWHQSGWSQPGYDPGVRVETITEAGFFTAPGLGRAIKFTFTLYDSRGIYKNGKTFTHIVWLDN